jgi:O-antigen/teichoic acid export membrane protein
MSSAPNYLANTSWMIAQAVVQRMLGLVSSLVLAHTLTPTAFGSYSVVNATSTTLYSLLRFGSDVGTHALTAGRDPTSEAEIVSDILANGLSLFLLIALIGTTVCLLSSDLVASRIFGDVGLTVFIRIAAPLMFFQVLAHFAYTAFAGLHRFTAYARIAALTGPLAPGLAIGGALTGGAVHAAIGFAAGQALTAIAILFGLWRLCRSLGVRLRPRLSINRFGSILRIGFLFYAASAVQGPVEYYFQSLMVSTHGVDTIANLRVTGAITSIVSFVPTAIAGPMLSIFARSHLRRSDQHTRLVLVNLKVLWLLGLTSVGALGPLWADVVRILFGSNYARAVESGTIALLSTVPVILMTVLSNDLLARGRVWLLFCANTIQMVLFATVAVVTIPKWGFEGYLSAQFFAGFVLLMIAAIQFLLSGTHRPEEKIPVAVMMLLSVTVCGLILVLIAVNVELGLWARLALSFAMPLLVAWASLRWVFAADEVDAIRQNVIRLAQDVAL